MARETKQERIVRNMFDQAVEHLHQLKGLVANPAVKEMDIEKWCEAVLRNCLGYTATNGYQIRSQETRGKSRPDLIILSDNKPICVAEVKKLDFDLGKSDFRSGKTQLAEYLTLIGDVRWGILTNGYEWRLYDFSQPALGGILVRSFDLRSEKGEVDVSKREVDEVCWDFVDFHESSYRSGAWEEQSKEATVFSPESLARAILSVDTVKYISKVIRGEHDYRVNIEVLFDKVSDLLSRGLDDAVSGWNEVKQLELNKYTSTQKRSSRRKKVTSLTKNEKEVEPGVAVAAKTELPVVANTTVDDNQKSLSSVASDTTKIDAESSNEKKAA